MGADPPPEANPRRRAAADSTPLTRSVTLHSRMAYEGETQTARERSNPSGRGRIALFGCVLASVLTLAPAAALASFEVRPTAGDGSAMTTGGPPHGRPFTATLATSFSPSHIEPGEPFTYTAKLVADIEDPSACPAGIKSSRTDVFYSWGFLQVGPGESYPTVRTTVAPVNFDSPSSTTQTTTEYLCPDERFTSGTTVVHVSGEESATIPPGCYQSVASDMRLYFPETPEDLQRFNSLSGTLSTLRVGDGLDCTKPGAGVTLSKRKIKFRDTDTASARLSCELRANPCVGEAEVALRPKSPDARTRSSCGGCSRPLATGSYSVAAGVSRRFELQLTPYGKRVLRRSGDCPRCRIAARISFRDPRTWQLSREPVRLRWRVRGVTKVSPASP